MIQVAAERPTFLQCNVADYAALNTAMSTAQVTNVCAVNIATTPIVGGIQVTLTGALPDSGGRHPGTAFRGQPNAEGLARARNSFQGLASGQSQSFTFIVPAKAAIGQIRVRCGDRRMIETKVAYTTRP